MYINLKIKLHRLTLTLQEDELEESDDEDDVFDDKNKVTPQPLAPFTPLSPKSPPSQTPWQQTGNLATSPEGLGNTAPNLIRSFGKLLKVINQLIIVTYILKITFSVFARISSNR